MVSVVWPNWCSSVAVERGWRGSSQDTMLLRNIQGSFTIYKAAFQPGVTDILYQYKLGAVRYARVSTS